MICNHIERANEALVAQMRGIQMTIFWFPAMGQKGHKGFDLGLAQGMDYW